MKSPINHCNATVCLYIRVHLLLSIWIRSDQNHRYPGLWSFDVFLATLDQGFCALTESSIWAVASFSWSESKNLRLIFDSSLPMPKMNIQNPHLASLLLTLELCLAIWQRITHQFQLPHLQTVAFPNGKANIFQPFQRHRKLDSFAWCGWSPSRGSVASKAMEWCKLSISICRTLLGRSSLRSSWTTKR